MQQQQQRREYRVHKCAHGQGAYNLGLVMGHHVTSKYIGDTEITDIIARFRVRQL